MQAGGGAQNFRTSTLFHALAGPLAGAEFAKLRFQFGRTRVDRFSAVFEFTVADFAKIAAGEHIANVAASPDPHNAKALSKALLDAAAVPGGYSVDALLDALLTPRIHGVIHRDVLGAFGPAGEDDYHAVLQQALLDMKRANHL